MSPPEMTFNAAAASRKKDIFPQARLPRICRRQLLQSLNVHTVARMERSPRAGFGIFTEFPFPLCRVKPAPEALGPRPFQDGFPWGLGPTNSRQIAFTAKTYSTSALCHLKQSIRYYHQDLHKVRDSRQAYAKPFFSRPSPSYAALAY